MTMATTTPIGQVIDLTKSPADNFLALLNASSGKSLVATDFIAGTPQASGQAAPAGNTSIHLTANNPSLFVGGADLTYDRVDLNHAAATVTPTYAVTPADTDATALAKIAAGLNVHVSEITNKVALSTLVPTTNGAQTPYEVDAIPSSLLYTGQAVAQLVWSGIATGGTVDQLLPTAQLPGFDPLYTDVAGVVQTQTLGGFDIVPRSPYVWSVQTVPQIPTTKQSTMLFANGLLWMCNSQAANGSNQTTLYGIDPLDGSTVYTVNVSAYTNVGPNAFDLFWIAFVDKNDLLWLVGQYNAASEPQIIRVDTSTGLIKDSIATAAGTKLQVLNLTEDETGDFVWVLSRNTSSGVVSLLKLDVTTGATLATMDSTYVGMTGLAIGDGLAYDPVNKRLWRGWNNGGVYSVTYIALNGSGVPSTSSTTSWGPGAQAGSSLLDAQLCALYSSLTGMELAFWDYSVTNQPALVRMNSADGTQIARTAVVVPYPGNSSPNWHPQGPVKYNRTTDELYVGVSYFQNGTFAYEVWAFKRTDPTISRVVFSNTGINNLIADFSIDANGSLYVYRSTGPSNALSRLR